MKEIVFKCEQWVPNKIEEVFHFFTEAKNLEKITPPHLNFNILKSSTENIEKGTLIDYKLKLYGIPLRWKTKISDYSHNKMFIDEQLKGPYKQWIHTHSFQEQDNGTLIIDQVRYIIPFNFLGNLLLGKFIQNDINKIFNYRKQVITDIFKPN